MAAQCVPRVIRAENIALLQLRDDEINEIVERAREIRRHDNKTVGHSSSKPFSKISAIRRGVP